ncbi:ferrous-iron efflux pump FieF [mine drainage metagenome]|uniref:Ferrous-iron efflux pump FieF n=1 Tax=mine drainage metagenome TaxID=410659 RepID=A0A1J5SIK8_9ZZZZ
MQKAQQNFRLQLWITTLSVILFVVKIIAYYFTNSLAILSDALESIVNVLAGFIGLFSLYVAAKPRDIEHPYGHGKAEFVSAAAEGSLIIAAGFFIVYETVQNIITKSPIEKLDTGLILVAATAVINYVAGSICIKLGKKNNSLALQASGKHLQIDTYSTIGVIGGLLIILFTQLYWLDKLIAALLSILIIYNGYKILRSSLAGIMDEADMDLIKKFVKVLNENRRDNWIDIHNLRVIKYGSTLHIDCHLTVPWYINVHEAHNEVDALGKIITNTFADSIESFVHTDGCLPFSCSICSKNDCEKRQHPFTHRIEWTLKNIITNQKHNSGNI